MQSSTLNHLLDAKLLMIATSWQSQSNIIPTNLQLAVSIAALSLLEKHSRQLWSFYAGMGKSYIVATTALLACVASLYK